VSSLRRAGGPTLQTFLTDRAVGHEFYLRGLVAVADPLTFANAQDADPLLRKQIVLSDRVVISKTDIASREQTEAITRLITQLVPGRPVVPMNLDNLDPDFLLREDLDLGARRSGFFADAVEHRAGVLSFPIFFDSPLPWDGFAQAIRVLAKLRGRDLLRIKGLVAIEGCYGPVVIHAVQHLVHDPVELRTWPDADHRSRLIFITRGIYPDEVEALFSAIIRIAKATGNSPAESPSDLS
jgi:G3E family GTPase